MDCEACTDRMVELLYEELPDADATATRAHLAACETCAAAFERLSSGQEMASMLQLEEPPADVHAAVMKAARAKAGKVAERTPTRETVLERTAGPRDDHLEAEDEGERGLWATFLHWIGGFAMRPQLAMALTLLLMVGIGLWYLDVGRRHDPADTHAIVDPAPGAEVGPSSSLEPAEPLDLEADPRTGRIYPREALEEEPTRRRGRSRRPRQARAEPAGAPQQGPRGGERAGRQLAPPAASEAPADDAPAIEGATGSPSLAENRDEGGEEVLDALGGPGRMAQLDLGDGEGFALSERSEGEAAEAQLAEPAPAPPGGLAGADAPTAAPSSAAGSASASGAAPAAAAPAEAPTAEVRRPAPDPSRLLPSALHRLARSQRAAGSCREAVRSYQHLLTRYANYARRPEAMIEAADCHRRLGQLSRARRLLEQAARTDRVAARARRALTELAAAERAHDRAAQ